MNSKIPNRKVMAIQARKKRVKPKKKATTGAAAAAAASAAAAPSTVPSSSNGKTDTKHEDVHDWGGNSDQETALDRAAMREDAASPEAEAAGADDRWAEDAEEDEDGAGAAKGSDEEEQEDPKDYRKGGYHPVKIGDYFNSRYNVVRKLGWGHFSTVWLCWDLMGKRFVALKVVKSASHYTETALDEIKLLRCVRDADGADLNRNRVVQLLDDFKISGVNGSHVCMVFEVLGCNLLKLIIRSKYRGIPLENVRTIMRQVLEGLDYLHTKCQIIHTDIKPENILLCVDERDVRKLASETIELQRQGTTLPASIVSTAPRDQRTNLITSDMSKKKRKRIKKKQKRQEMLMQEQEKQLLELDRQAGEEEPSEVAEDRFTRHHDAKRSPGTKERKAVHAAMEEDEEVISSSGVLSASAEETIAELIIAGGGVDKSVTAAALAATDNSRRASASAAKVNGVRSQAASINATTVAPPASGNSPIPSSSSLAGGDFCRYDSTSLNGGLPGSETGGGGDADEFPPRALNLTPCGFMNDLAGRPDPINTVCDIPVKIADLGNACWTNLHFTEDIQTRQYRSLEVLIGAGYGPPADIWSASCMAFELATGDYLFEPHSGDDYSRDEDHIAHIIELLGNIPRHLALAGTYSREYFNRRGELRNISDLRPWGMYEVLLEKYRWHPRDAAAFSDFLTPMLDFDPQCRATAAECLRHPWLTGDEDALNKRLFPERDDGEVAASGNENSSSDLEEFVRPPRQMGVPRGGGVDADYSDEGGDAEDEDEDDWQSTSDPNNTHSTNSESGGVNPDYMTAQDVSVYEEEDGSSPAPNSFLDPALVLGTLEDIGVNVDKYKLPTSRPGGLPRRPRGSRDDSSIVLNGGGGGGGVGDTTGSEERELCDDVV
ncbi:SRSF protein kinase 2 [Hypsibius exemplaris]|uniref:non-specific serine/threonine protein kinase n=1 Tax=Hypsibius exemplaris TaxID=2072580 RepID=A0A1W0WVZ8_HYPEX|nr:SRSF protein kinase 2 [Hypsibius exemplaris]